MVSKLLVFVLGAPGAGKGTQSELILKAEEFEGWSHISAGDLLRAQVQVGTEVGKQAAEYLKEGLMVPSSMIIGLLEEALANGSHTKVLIDGFPRVLHQLHDFEKQVGPCSKTLFFNVPEKVARQRLLQRGENSGRVDDNEETIRTRFKVFESESMPVIEALREQGKVAEIDASASPEEVFAATKLVIQQLEQQYQQQQQQQQHTAVAAEGEPAAAAAAEEEEPFPAVEPTPAAAESATAEQATPQEGAAVDESAAAEASTLAAAAEPAAEASDVAAAASAPAAEAEASEAAAAAEASMVTTTEQPPSEGSGVEPAAEISASEAVAAAEQQAAAAAEQAPVAVEAPASEQKGVPVESADSSATEQAPAGLPAQTDTPAAEVAIPAAAAMAAAAAAEVAAPVELAGTASSAAAEPAAAGVMDLQMSGIRTPIVICGPSGVGKGTLINKLMQQYPDRFGFSVSHTTRAPRPGEQHGVHYYFTDPSAMKPQIEAGMFLEHAEVHGNMYGTSLAAVARVSSEGRHCVLDIDVQGAQLVKASALGSRCFFIFVAPPSHEELERRLRNRGTETEEKVLQRLANAEAEISKAEEPGLFDHVLVNGDLEVAYYQLQLVINQRVPGLLPEVLTQPPPQPAAAEAAAVHDSAVTSAPVEAAAVPVSSLEVPAPVAAAVASGITAAATAAAAAPMAEPLANGTAQLAATPAAAGGTSTLLDFGFGASAGPAVAVKGMPVRQYMDVTVIPVLREGLKALNSARPDDPWQFLADYLVAHKPVAH